MTSFWVSNNNSCGELAGMDGRTRTPGGAVCKESQPTCQTQSPSPLNGRWLEPHIIETSINDNRRQCRLIYRSTFWQANRGWLAKMSVSDICHSATERLPSASNQLALRCIVLPHRANTIQHIAYTLYTHPHTCWWHTRCWHLADDFVILLDGSIDIMCLKSQKLHLFVFAVSANLGLIEAV